MAKNPQPMSEAELRAVSASLSNVAAAIAERIRHEGQSAPFKDYQEHMQLEVLRLRGEGQTELADAVAAFAAKDASNA